MCEGRPQYDGMEHSGERHVDREPDAARGTRGAVLPRGRVTHERQLRVRVPRLEVVVLVDQDPDVLEAPLHLALRLDETRHSATCPEARRMARWIFG